MYRDIRKMPQNGQFAQVWKRNGRIRAATYAWINNNLRRIDPVNDMRSEPVEESSIEAKEHRYGAVYIILEENRDEQERGGSS